ncbi:SRPBCC family protein [Variovorax sp. J22R133]|uniref:CoxG family protein n=1 Tax=Variovorax brevis TaxID=3053503 RepID=UPI00257666AA|nr:SRPBCC family protein [Variovorax sp. J22R133]MDM0113360.1 SRPBCC family protein [Variovorax sp. J22R133]
MEVKLEKRYPLEVDSARAWQVLRDVAAVAGCMPGAAITDKVDDTHYKGQVKVKVGPANAAFAGDIEVLALEEQSMTLQLLGKGADRAGSSASMDLRATIEHGETPATSVLVGQATVIVNGKFAQFGGRLMTQVSDMLLAQFADNFRAAAAALPAPVPVASVGAAALQPEAANDAGVAFTAPVAARQSVSASAPPAQASEINALAIAWNLVKGWFAGLFGKRQA